MNLVKPAGVRKYAQKTNILEKLNPRISLTALVVFGLSLRLFFLRFRFAAAFDEVNYLKLGVTGYLQGLDAVLHTYWSPLLPGLVAVFCNFFPDHELAARMVSVLAGCMLIVPVYHIGKAVFGKEAGLLAAAFVSIFPPIAFQSTLILTEPLLMLFGAFAILFGLKMLEKHSIANALLASLSAGLAYLAHPLGFGFFALLLGWLVPGVLAKSFLITRLRLMYLLPVMLAGFLFVTGPYLFFLKAATGGWTLSAKGAANQQMSTPLKGEQSSFRALEHTNHSVPIDQVFHQGTFLQSTNGGEKPVREVKMGPFLLKFVKNFSNMLQRAIPQMLTTIPALLLGVGLFGSAWPVQRAKYILYLLSFLCFFWLILIPAFHINLRYLTPMWPVCAVFIARGLVVIYDWLRDFMPITRRTGKKRIDASIVAGSLALLVFIIFSFLPEFGRVWARSPHSAEYVADAVEQKKAGEWLKKNVKGKPVIMSRNHAVDFYAGNYNIVESVTIPTNSFDRVMAYARNRNVTHLVLNERYLSDYPQLGFLLERDHSSAQLKQIYKDVHDNGLATVIYELQ